MNDLDELRSTYGKEAQFSEHKRGDKVRYLDCDGHEQSGTILWIQAAFQSQPMKYVIAPDTEGAFLDFALPSDVITQDEQEPTLQACPYCPGKHYNVEQCPLKPKQT
jgi:hypothetical protein